jgi:hypothetical protein
MCTLNVFGCKPQPATLQLMTATHGFCSRSSAAHNISKSLIGYAAISVATHTSGVLSYGLWPGAKQPLYVLCDRYINLDYIDTLSLCGDYIKNAPIFTSSNRSLLNST